MARIPVNVRDLPTQLAHDPITFGENSGAGICLYCGAQVDQSTRKERCLKHEDYVDWEGNPFRPEGTH